jgi:hypothetical protein
LHTPAHGSVEIILSGAFTCTPALNYNGPDGFTFAVSDGSLSGLGQVSIIVDPVNDALSPMPAQTRRRTRARWCSLAAPSPARLLSIQAIETAWDFGDGESMTGTLTPTHSYADDGIYTVTLVVTDELGGVGVDTLLATVANVAPDLAPIAGQSVTAGEWLTLTASYADPGWLDTHRAVIDWGDGLTETIHLAAGLTGFDFAHAYDTAGAYTVTLTLTDDDGGQDVLTFTILVEPASFNTWLPVVLRH